MSRGALLATLLSCRPARNLMRRTLHPSYSIVTRFLDFSLAAAVSLGCSSDAQSDGGGGGGSEAVDALPGAEGGECVGGDLCDYGLVCVEAVCVPGDREPLGGGPTAAGGASAGSSSGGVDNGGGTMSSGGSGGSSSSTTGGAGGVAATGGTPGTGGRPGPPGGGAGGAASGGAAGAATGGTAAGGAATGGTAAGGASDGGGIPTGGGGPGPGCAGIPAFNQTCAPTSCYCSANDSCYSFATAATCCAVAPVCP
jgi:hypothetical protein